MASHVRRFCQISRHLTAPSNHLVRLLAPLDHIGSHWITLTGSCNRGCWVFYFCSASYQTQPLDDPAALRTAVLRGDREASNLHSHLALSAFRWVNFQVRDHADEALQSNSVSEADVAFKIIQDAACAKPSSKQFPGAVQSAEPFQPRSPGKLSSLTAWQWFEQSCGSGRWGHFQKTWAIIIWATKSWYVWPSQLFSFIQKTLEKHCYWC